MVHASQHLKGKALPSPKSIESKRSGVWERVVGVRGDGELGPDGEHRYEVRLGVRLV
jgi:hypothetical protein